jgi:hypothetical protein
MKDLQGINLNLSSHLLNEQLLNLRGGTGDEGTVYCKQWSEPCDILLGTVEADCGNALSACSDTYPETDYATCLPQ